MTNEKGYIKIYRSLLDWEWWSDDNVLKLYLYILLSANWRDKRWQGKEIKRGEFVTSIDKLSAGTNLTRQQVRTALEKLKSSGEIITQTQRGVKYTIIRVCKFDEYQEQQRDNIEITQKQHRDNTEITSKQHRDNTEITTTKEKKEYKEREEGKEKKERKNNNKTPTPEIYFPEDEKLNKAFCDYVEMRKEIKAKMTDRAVQLAIKKLNNLSGGDNDKAIAILEQSVMNSWKGLFELKEPKKTSNNLQWIDNIKI